MALIRKIGLCVVRRRRLLVLLKEGGSTYILPGGKPEKGETDEEALARHRAISEDVVLAEKLMHLSGD